MLQPEQHQMHLIATHPSGAEEWYCPMCGRRFLLQWPPAYKKIILEPGDEHVVHSGGKGGMEVGAAAVSPQSADLLAAMRPADALPAADERESADVPLTDELRPWVDWLRKSGLDRHWDNSPQ